MNKKMKAVCIVTVSLLFTACGNGAGASVQDGSVAGQDSQDTQERDAMRESEETADAAGGIQRNEETADAASGGGQDAGSEPVQPAGKTISIFGDSISTFRDHNPEGYAVFFPEYGAVKAVEDTWWHQIVEEYSLTLYANDSSAGATVVGDSTGMEDPRCACNELRTSALGGPGGACPDIIIVYLGTNDLLESIPLGTNDGTLLVEEGKVDAFSDAYTLMLDKLQSNYPPAEIYCCTLLPIGDYGTETPYVDFVNGEGLTAAAYSEVIGEIAANRDLCVIDLRDCGIAVENLHEMTTDGVHPTAEGMACIAEAVGKALAAE